MKNKRLFWHKKRMEILLIGCLLLIFGFILFYLRSETKVQNKVFNVYRQSENKKVPESMVIPEPKKKVTIYDATESEAKFTKGNVTQYILQYVEYTDKALELGIEGTVIIKFIVEKDGSVTNVRIQGEKLGGGLDELAVKAVKKTNKMWRPGIVNGKPVRTSFRVPITFRLPP